MQDHPLIGAQIVKGLPDSQKIIDGIKHHHERWDGTGYPDALRKEEIPFFARIISVADAFDALTSGRPYVGKITEHQAIQKLIKESHLFDPRVLKAFLKTRKFQV